MPFMLCSSVSACTFLSSLLYFSYQSVPETEN
nr:MAG TPA: hypothetical protein [Caudoviricetes sp.]